MRASRVSRGADEEGVAEETPSSVSKNSSRYRSVTNLDICTVSASRFLCFPLVGIQSDAICRSRHHCRLVVTRHAKGYWDTGFRIQLMDWRTIERTHRNYSPQRDSVRLTRTSGREILFVGIATGRLEKNRKICSRHEVTREFHVE